MIARVSFFVCLLCVTLVNAKSNRIVGGDKAIPGQFKYIISLQSNKQHICGGSIIADQYILTAAHCVSDKKGKALPNKFQVVAGSINLLTKQGVRIDVEKIYLLEESPYLVRGNDIAVLKLQRGLGLDSNPNLDKIDLPSSQESLYVDHDAVVSGYGQTKVDLQIDPKTGEWHNVNYCMKCKLKYAAVDIISNEECARKNARQIVETIICGQVVQRQREPEGTCVGDSGGPLVVGNTVVGILSSGRSACREDRYAAIYTRVSSYTDFIMKVMEGVTTSGMVVRVINSGESSNSDKRHSIKWLFNC